MGCANGAAREAACAVGNVCRKKDAKRAWSECVVPKNLFLKIEMYGDHGEKGK